MRILLVGATGMLGSDVAVALGHHDLTRVGSAELDVRDADACMRAVAGHDAVVNASAYTAVDAAETDEPAASALNADGPAYLAAATAAHAARLVHVSTDYVFDGSATSPYAEDAPTAPASAYGRTKAEGERRVRATDPDAVVLRTAWLYGGGRGFPSTMLRLARERDELSVVDDQHGQPTWTRDLAGAIAAILDRGVRGATLHGTSTGATTWFGLARAALEAAGLDPERVRPTDSAGFVRPAPRPAYSVLGHDGWAATGIAPIRHWREALAEAVAEGAVA